MSKWMIAVDLGGTKILGGLLAADGQLVATKEIPTEAKAGAADILARLRALVATLRDQAPGPVAGIGVASPGVINDGRVIYATPNLPGWSGLHLADLVSQSTGLPVRVENDAHAAAWGEYIMGAGQGGVRDLVLITLGTGVGGGIVVGGNLIRGADGFAARLGHISVAAGPACFCGNRGCLEMYASGHAVVRRTLELLARGAASSLQPDPDLTARAIVDAARLGDALAIKVLTAAGRALGRALVQVVEMLNPSVISIGGGMAAAGSLLLGPAEAVVRHRARPEAVAALDILPARLGSNAGLYGAGQLAWLHLRPNVGVRVI